MESFLAALTDDVDWYAPGGAPFSGRRTGRDEVRRYFEQLMKLVTVDEFDLQDVLADGDRVVALGRERDTVKATGRHYEFDWAHVYTLRKGKIAAVKLLGDTHAEASAFGESTREREAMGGPLGITHEAYSGRSRE